MKPDRSAEVQVWPEVTGERIDVGLRRAATWSLVRSVLMTVTGAVTIGLPTVAGVAVTAIIAWLPIFSGVLHLGLTLTGGGATVVVWEVLLGVV